jgi:hypothetical protein
LPGKHLAPPKPCANPKLQPKEARRAPP